MSSNQAQLEQLTQKKSVVNWFNGLFTQLHLEITDTGEKFTILHHGDRAEVVSGFQAKKPNFIVPLMSENVGNLVHAFSDDTIDAQEEYRIVKFMLVPCLRAALAMPVLNNAVVHKIVKIDTHWQEVLLDPSGNEDVQVTIIYVNKQWLVIPGLHGTPNRRLALTPVQLMDFQRRVLAADASGKISDWAALAKWYADWREEITLQ